MNLFIFFAALATSRESFPKVSPATGHLPARKRDLCSTSTVSRTGRAGVRSSTRCRWRTDPLRTPSWPPRLRRTPRTVWRCWVRTRSARWSGSIRPKRRRGKNVSPIDIRTRNVLNVTRVVRLISRRIKGGRCKRERSPYEGKKKCFRFVFFSEIFFENWRHNSAVQCQWPFYVARRFFEIR